jgi:hypothetical protein
MKMGRNSAPRTKVMNRKLVSCVTIGAVAAALALATPVMARGGGASGGHGGGPGGAGGRSGGRVFDGMGHSAGRGAFTGPGGSRFAGRPFGDQREFAGRFNGRPRFRDRGSDYTADYDYGCWRRAWTPYGWNWVNICYGYDSY